MEYAKKLIKFIDNYHPADGSSETEQKRVEIYNQLNDIIMGVNSDDFYCVSSNALVYGLPCKKWCGSEFCKSKARRQAEQLLQDVKKQHPNYDPNWKGKSTFSEEFVLKLINYVRDQNNF